MPDGADSATQPVVRLDTGEVLSLQAAPPEDLAEALLVLRDHETRARDYRRRVENELSARMMQRERGLWMVGDYELRLKQTRESVWDEDELETVLRELYATGVLDAREAVGVITHETVVHRAEASRLVKRLSGRARAAVERCCTWRTKGATLEVTRSTGLLEEPEA